MHSHSHHFRRIGVCPKFRKLCMKNSGIAVFVKLQTSRSPTFRNSKLAITNRNVYRWLSCWYCSDWWSLLTYAFCFLSVTLLNGRVFSCTNDFAINALACTNVCAIGGYDRVYYCSHVLNFVFAPLTGATTGKERVFIQRHLYYA